jgi:hypothetical protein
MLFIWQMILRYFTMQSIHQPIHLAQENLGQGIKARLTQTKKIWLFGVMPCSGNNHDSTNSISLTLI